MANQRLEKETDQRILKEYARGTAMLRKAAQRHFKRRAHKILGQELNKKLKWIEAVTLERRTYKAQRKYLRENRRRFEHYFDQVPHPD